jgi:16S rRNA (cytosine1402-N4)-methyltransferase
MIKDTIHIPVLLEEVLEHLNPQAGQNFIDCTFGGGGHSLRILEAIKPAGKLIGIDWDPEAVTESHGQNLIIVNDNYKNLEKIVKKIRKDDNTNYPINGVLLDLGLSSDQLDGADRGFSFNSKKSLDLRFDQKSENVTGTEILANYNEHELFKIFKEYGEEPLAKQIAKAIVDKRMEGEPVETAEMLVQLISAVYQRYFKDRSRRNPATRVLQALRIAVNDEFGNIATVLPQAISLLESGGKLAVISFHSGEDRIVKKYFKEMAGADYPLIKIITKKPIIASDQEVEDNPRSRSAKMRVIEKL